MFSSIPEANEVRMKLLNLTLNELHKNVPEVKINNMSQKEYEKFYSENLIVHLPTTTILSKVERKVSFKTNKFSKEYKSHEKIIFQPNDIQISNKNVRGFSLDSYRNKNKNNYQISSLKTSINDKKELALVSMKYLHNIALYLNSFKRKNYKFCHKESSKSRNLNSTVSSSEKSFSSYTDFDISSRFSSESTPIQQNENEDFFKDYKTISPENNISKNRPFSINLLKC